MRFALIADTFPPLRNSGAVQLRDLAREFVRQGHDLTVILPAPELQMDWKVEEIDGVKVVRLKAPQMRNVGHLRRTFAEFAMPFAMRHGLKKIPLEARRRWDGVIWYSPSIFHGPLVNTLKRTSNCKSYLIIRDIFPDWAVDMGLMRKGPAYRFFKEIANYQYAAADVIGVQTPGNLPYFGAWRGHSDRSIEVLPNWLGAPGTKRSTIRLDETSLAGRRVFVYAGNMGVAQNMSIIIGVAERLRHRNDLGFLLVGRGSEVRRLTREVASREIPNLLFFDEIDPDEIPDLYSQCFAGIVSLDPRHKSHNIPGKFLTYMQSGLPVIANLNAGNDLASLVRDYRVGMVSEDGDTQTLARQIERMMACGDTAGYKERCLRLFAERFSVAQAAKKILSHF